MSGMDDKTEELRDIFMDVSEEGTVTESQAETRGSLTTDGDDEGERLRGVVTALRDRESSESRSDSDERADSDATREPFDTGLDIGTYVHIVRGFYDGQSDEAIADDLDLTAETVFRSRMDLHLIRDEEVDGLDRDAMRDRRAESDAALAEAFGVDEATVRRARRVVAAEDAARAANYRYRTEFEEVLTDAALSGEYAGGVHEDGLDEAAEDIETDVSF